MAQEVAPVPSVTPAWSRPDDAVRQAQLDAMKRQATGLLALAGVIFVGASLFERAYPWLGYVRATAEASLVGGLADWFAVTALFRHPLGLPIPHTAIVATRKERIGRILGNFVQNHFLSRDVIALNLRAVHPAERAARWLSDPAHSRQIARQLAGGLAKTLEALPDEDARELVRQVVSTRVRATRVAPALGRTLALVLEGDHHQGFLNEAVRIAAQAISDSRDFIREKVRAESPWWVPGVVDDKIYQRIIEVTEALLRAIGADPRHPLRKAFDSALRDFVDRLQYSPDVIAKADIIVTTTGNKDIVTVPAMRAMKHQAIVANVGHFDNEIDMAGLGRVPGVIRINIKPQVDEWVFPDGHSIIVLSEGRLMNLGNATGHPSFVMSNSFSNQVIAQVELYTKHEEYNNDVYRLPKILDEKVAKIHVLALGGELTKLSKDQAEYIGVDVEGPFKPEHYRY